MLTNEYYVADLYNNINTIKPDAVKVRVSFDSLNQNYELVQLLQIKVDDKSARLAIEHDILMFTGLSEPASLQGEMSTVLDDYTSMTGSASVQ